MILSASTLGFHGARGTTSPSSGTITQGTNSSVSWTGGPPVPNPTVGLTTNFDPSNCQTLGYCDLFTLTLNLNSNIGTSFPQYYANLTITWADPSQDYDLYVYRNGALVGSGTLGAGTAYETVIVKNALAGTYQIYGDNWAVAPGNSYAGVATLSLTTPPFSFPTRSAIYHDDTAGKFAGTPFKFTPDQLLIGAQGNQCNKVTVPSTVQVHVCPQDLEPSIKIDQFGTIYASAIHGTPGGTDFWRSTDKGTSFTYLGEPDGPQNSLVSGKTIGGLGGGDDDLAVGTPFPIVGPNGLVSSPGRVYLSSLWWDGFTLFPEGITVSNSIDQGNNWLVSQTMQPFDDRQWSVATGASNYYLTFNWIAPEIAGTTNLVMLQSTDGGLTFARGGFIGKSLGNDISVFQGPVTTSPDGSLYNVYIGPNVNQIQLVKCPAPCNLPVLGTGGLPSVGSTNNFQVTQAFKGPNNMTVANVFPQVAVDHAGNIYVAFSTGRNVYMIGSSNGGNTWTLPVKVNNGTETATALEPWMQAGDNGHVALMWYGTDTIGSGTADPVYGSAKWKLFYAVTPNAMANTPTFNQVVASGGPDLPDGIVHVGFICTQGTACPSGSRNLAEYSSFTFDSQGFANIVYAQDKNTPTGRGQTEYTKEIAGPSSTVPPPCRESDGEGDFQGNNGNGHVSFDRDGCIDGDHDSIDETNRGDGRDFHSTEIQRVEYDDTAHTMTISGIGTSNGLSVAFTLVALETGLGVPGWVSFAFSDGFTNAGYLTSGSILLH